MKRRAVLCAALLAAALITALALWSAHGTRVKTLDGWVLAGWRDVMRVDASVEEDLRRVTGTQQLALLNRTGQDQTELVLRLYPNAVTENSLVLRELTVDGQEAAFSQDADDPSVLRVQVDWAAGEQLALSWRFTLVIPREEGWFYRTNEEALCVGALAVPALWQDGAWRTDEWDVLAGPLGASKFDYLLTLDAPETVLAAFGGALIGREKAEDGRVIWTVQGDGALDMPFALRLRSEGVLRQRDCGGVLVTVLAQSAAKAKRLLSQAEKALSSLDKIGLPYEGRSLCIAQAQTIFADGLIGSGLIAVGEETDEEQLLRRLTRLIARQRFGVAAQSDPWNAPWLSATLASAAELLAYRARAGEHAYETRFFGEVEVATRLTRPHGVTVGASVDRFGGDEEMTQVLRDQGAAMLLGIEEAVGEEAFLRALARYSERGEDVLADQALLEAALLEATGSSWSGYLADELSW